MRSETEKIDDLSHDRFLQHDVGRSEYRYQRNDGAETGDFGYCAQQDQPKQYSQLKSPASGESGEQFPKFSVKYLLGFQCSLIRDL